MIAPGESQEYNWAARGWEVMSHFVCLWYSVRAVAKIDSNFVEEVAVGGTWVKVLVEAEKDMVPDVRSSLPVEKREDWRESIVVIPPRPNSGILETVSGLSEKTRA